MRPDALILAIDHGTSGVKPALVTPAGDVLASVAEPTRLELLPGGGAEQDPEDWWRALVSGTRRLLADTGVDPARVIALGCSSTFSTTVAVDAAGHALAPALTWLDGRGAPHVQRAMRGWPRVAGYGLRQILRFVPRTGGGPTLSGKDDVAHVLFWKHERPEVYAEAAAFLSSKDWFNLRLTGRAAASHDSITLFWITDNRDVDRVRYAPDLLRALGLDAAKFPALKPSTSVLGPLLDQAADALGLPRGLPVAVGSPDLQSACVGSGAVQDYQAHLYLGTSSWILCHVPIKRTDPFHAIASLPSSLPGRWFAANEQDMAGGALDHFLDAFVYPDSALRPGARPADAHARLGQAAAAVPPGSRGVVYGPWLNGEKTPVDDARMRGAFAGLGMDTSLDDLARAVLEGVACNTRWAREHVERFVRRRLEPVHVIGGGAQSDLWCQIHADVWDRRLKRVVRPRDANARGAAWIAALALGLVRVEDLPSLVRFDAEFTPDPATRGRYDDVYARFADLASASRRLGRHGSPS